MKNFYDILGVGRNASREDIKEAYGKLADIWRPNIKLGNQEAVIRFREIIHAYKVLKDPIKRKKYDELSEEDLKKTFNSKDLDDIVYPFGKHLNDGNRSGRTFTGNLVQKENIPQKGGNVEVELFIDLISALRGLEASLNIKKSVPCETCGGRGESKNAVPRICKTCNGTGKDERTFGPYHFSERCRRCGGSGKLITPCEICNGQGIRQVDETLKIKIPMGVSDGDKIKAAGKGEPGLYGGKNGDLYVIVKIREHPVLTRTGRDISMDVPVTLYEAVMGHEIIIPYIDGPLKLKLPAHSQSGQVIKVTGKGAFNPATKSYGDLRIKLNVKIPKSRDAEFFKAVKKIQEYYKRNVRGHIKF